VALQDQTVEKKSWLFIMSASTYLYLYDLFSCNEDRSTDFPIDGKGNVDDDREDEDKGSSSVASSVQGCSQRGDDEEGTKN
jgi:hypothetical protein